MDPPQEAAAESPLISMIYSRVMAPGPMVHPTSPPNSTRHWPTSSSWLNDLFRKIHTLVLDEETDPFAGPALRNKGWCPEGSST